LKYNYGKSVAHVTSAEGVTGVLCKGFDNEFVFRVYKESGEFDDYEIRHDDLEVTVSAEAMAAFYQIGESKILDHSPSVLGLDRCSERQEKPKKT